MPLKQKILALLTAQAPRGGYLSGEALAEQLGVSRAAVWKAINALRAGGCQIEAVTNRGYALAGGDFLDPGAIAPLLRCDIPGLQIEVSTTLPSTNTALRARAQSGAPEGLVLLAAEQTEGRGRAGRDFYSPAGTGLYLSLLLRPVCATADAPLLTLAAATAAAEAIEEVTGQSPAIKWVNDLLLGGKKICGILTEAALSLESGGLEYAVLGFGLNLAPPDGGFPAPLADIAGALYPSAADIPSGTRCRLAAAFLSHLWPYCQNLPARAFLAGYRQRLAWQGQRITVLPSPGQTAGEATLLGIDNAGRLRVRRPDDSEETLSGGEVRLLGVPAAP